MKALDAMDSFRHKLMWTLAPMEGSEMECWLVAELLGAGQRCASRLVLRGLKCIPSAARIFEMFCCSPMMEAQAKRM